MPTLLGLGPEVRLRPLEPQLRPWGLFTQVVPDISEQFRVGGADRTAFGARWLTQTARVPYLDAFDCDGDEDITGDVINLTDTQTLGFSDHLAITCTTIGGLSPDDLNDYLRFDAALLESAALVRALTVNSLHADVLNFVADSTALAATTTAVGAMSVIEGGLAARIANARGYIFISPTLLAHFVNNGVVRVIDGELLSPGGHWVISDSGHAAGVTTTVFGTGALSYSISEPHLVSGDIGTFDAERNITTAAYVRYGAVMFNPAHTVSTALTIA